MDNLLPVQHLQAPQKSMGEPTDESETEALEVVFFDELVQVHPEERKKRKMCSYFLMQLKHNKSAFWIFLFLSMHFVHTRLGNI